MSYTPLFPYPFCCVCFSKLHDGHHGWDVCAQCREREVADPRYALKKIEEDPEDWTCECYQSDATYDQMLGGRAQG